MRNPLPWLETMVDDRQTQLIPCKSLLESLYSGPFEFQCTCLFSLCQLSVRHAERIELKRKEVLAIVYTLSLSFTPNQYFTTLK